MRYTLNSQCLKDAFHRATSSSLQPARLRAGWTLPPAYRPEASVLCRSSFYGGNFFRSKPGPVEHLIEEDELVPQRCSQCGGSGRCTCQDCQGRGRLSRAGYNKKNRVDMTRILGSKWTAMKETMGWRHFSVVQLRKGASGVTFVQMQASCDPATQLWINATNLKDRDIWAAGWLQKSEMEDPQGALSSGVPCRACRGSGAIPCPICDATGAVLMPAPQLSSPIPPAVVLTSLSPQRVRTGGGAPGPVDGVGSGSGSALGGSLREGSRLRGLLRGRGRAASGEDVGQGDESGGEEANVGLGGERGAVGDEVGGGVA